MIDRETMLQLADDAGFEVHGGEVHALSARITKRIELFATAVAQKAAEAEREACALVADDGEYVAEAPGGNSYYAQLGDASATAANIATAIRARSTGGAG